MMCWRGQEPRWVRRTVATADLTTIADLRPGSDGNLYAVQMGQFTEQGPIPNSGAIIRVKQGDTSEVVVSGLPFPTSIDFNAGDDDAYVTTNGVGAPGSGEVLMFAALTKQEGVLPELL
jgi:sugar lactone lactonase YvrE